MKILLTGGHLGPALGLIEVLQKNHELIFVGRKYSLSHEKVQSLEFKEISKKNLRFYHLEAGRLTRIVSIRSFLNFLRFPLGFFQAFKILISQKPDIILSLGGYIGFPISLAGALLGIPLYIHEQTIHPGLANRISGYFAKRIFVTFKETSGFFKHSKVLLTGNPVRKNILKIIDRPFILKRDRPVIYITGGSLGSHSINLIIEKILSQLMDKYTLIHQTGNVKEYNDFTRIKNLKDSLPPRLKDHYIVREHFLDNDLGYIFSISDLVIGRSGANTLFELIAWEKPSILIPLPWSSQAEQFKHARLMKQSGVAEIFEQHDNPQNLLALIEKVLREKDSYESNFKNLSKYYKADAASIIKKTIESEKK